MKTKQLTAPDPNMFKESHQMLQVREIQPLAPRTLPNTILVPLALSYNLFQPLPCSSCTAGETQKWQGFLFHLNGQRKCQRKCGVLLNETKQSPALPGFTAVHEEHSTVRRRMIYLSLSRGGGQIIASCIDGRLEGGRGSWQRVKGIPNLPTLHNLLPIQPESGCPLDLLAMHWWFTPRGSPVVL